MAILDITNRTENWKTAQYFAPFFDNDCRLTRLAKKLEESSDSQPIVLELFWKGMRDYVHSHKQTDKPKEEFSSKFANLYNCIFASTASPLREHIAQFIEQEARCDQRIKKLEEHHYASCVRKEDLYNNLFNTEIDIVLQTPTHLFIGEAKDKSALGSDGKLVLVHQLIRQYVMAKILLAIVSGPRLVVVPFLVVDNPQAIKNNLQVRFMMDQEWLKEGNILDWDDIKDLCTE